jgi:hypothetical protein
MKRLKSCLLASAGLVILAATLSLTAPGRAFAQRVGEDCVRICDTAASPLHVIIRGVTRVTGDVTINNESAIATTVTGPVQVTTSPREPLYVIERMKVDNIFQEQVSLMMKPDQNFVQKDFVVPYGKFLEIKHASGTLLHIGMPLQPFKVLVSVIQPNNNVFDFYLPRVLQDFNDGNTPGADFSLFHVGGDLNGIFGDSGSTVQVRLERTFISYETEMKLELAITGEYHDF